MGETGADIFCKPFFVHIIESPSSDDLFDGRTEGGVLRSALGLAEIPHRYFLAVNKKLFYRALDEVGTGHDDSSKSPIIHISSHGDASGIGLTDGTLLPWQELGPKFSALNEDTGDSLGVCFSTCKGARATLSAFLASRLGFKRPFRWTAGSEKNLLWDDAAIAFIAFYHRLAQGANLDHATVAMRCASGNNSFYSFAADQFGESRKPTGPM